MRLIDVYMGGERITGLGVLWSLMLQREQNENISHREMPTWDRHVAFVESRPYLAWYIVDVDDYARGAVYLTRQREIGVGILKGERGHGYALDAVAELMRLHPGRFLANINPKNEASIRLFAKLGFTGPIQVTYAREA